MTTMMIDGVDVHYERTEAGGPLLLIHGNGGGAVAWCGIVDTLRGAR